jgi:hypothetical protein
MSKDRVCKIPNKEPKSLKSVIEKGEKDFAEGKGKRFTLDELRALIRS